MKITHLQNKTICILGYGREGRSTHEWLADHNITRNIIIADDKKLTDTSTNDTVHDQGTRKDHLSDYDIIIRTAGISPQHDALTDHQHKITSQTQIFFDNYQGDIIAVTGTKGKSTTATLITRILQQAGHTTQLVGNIGNPTLSMIDLFDSTTRPDYVVCELSSFQLIDADINPTYAIITNLLTDHVDRHGSIAQYHQAKYHIISPDTTLITHASCVDHLMAHDSSIRAIYAGSGTEYDFDNTMFATPDRHYPTDIRLPGTHNRENICLINALMHQLHITPDHIYNAIKDFTGLPHRMQLVSEKNNIRRIDDSQSTNPSTCITAIHTYGNEISTMMLGGYQSHFDYSEVVETIRQYSSIQTLLLFPDTIEDFRQHITTQDTRNIINVMNMKEAVDRARDHTESGKICILSPGAKSFSLRTSMAERGTEFATHIKAHT